MQSPYDFVIFFQYILNSQVKFDARQDDSILPACPVLCWVHGSVNDDAVNAKHAFNVESQSNEITAEDETFGYFRRDMKSKWPCKF